jgi:hypothetical protein
MLRQPSGPNHEGGSRMFLFKLEKPDGTPADPATHSTAAPNWRAGDTIPLGGRVLRVVGVRANAAEEPPVLIVEDVAESATSDAA